MKVFYGPEGSYKSLYPHLVLQSQFMWNIENCIEKFLLEGFRSGGFLWHKSSFSKIFWFILLWKVILNLEVRQKNLKDALCPFIVIWEHYLVGPPKNYSKEYSLFACVFIIGTEKRFKGRFNEIEYWPIDLSLVKRYISPKKQKSHRLWFTVQKILTSFMFNLRILF